LIVQQNYFCDLYPAQFLDLSAKPQNIIVLMVQTKLISDLYLTKFLDILAKPFFPYSLDIII